MKLSTPSLKRAQAGLIHWATILPILVIGVVAIIGVHVLTASHADSSVTLYWCPSNGTNFSYGANWDTSSTCSGGIHEKPANGDNLVFASTSSTITGANNDMSGLTVNSITFVKGTGPILLFNNPLTIAGGGIIDNGTSEQITAPIILSTDQTWSGSGALQIGGAVTIGPHNLTITNTNTHFQSGAQPYATGTTSAPQFLNGTGTLTINSGNGLVAFSGPSSNFSGPVNVTAGTASISDPKSLGTGTITVANGATVRYYTWQTAATVANNFILGGGSGSTWGFDTSGNSIKIGQISVCMNNDLSTGCDTNPVATTTLTLSGTVTLNGDTQFGDSHERAMPQTINLTGTIVYQGHALSAVPNSNAAVNTAAAIIGKNPSGGTSSVSGTSGVPSSQAVANQNSASSKALDNSTATYGVCDATKIAAIMGRVVTRSQNEVNLFNTIMQNVQTYAQSKQATMSPVQWDMYKHMLAQAEQPQGDATGWLQELQAKNKPVDCSSILWGTRVHEFEIDLQQEIISLQKWSNSLKQVITLLKTDTGGNH